MIGRIRGIILEKQAPNLLIDVNGVGYELQAPLSTFYQLADIGKEVILFTHMVVREDAQLLYGFNNKAELNLFKTLLKVSGVGPRLALTILSGGDANSFVRCVMEEDISSLIKLPGIGRKTAGRLLLEMKDKLADWHLEHSGDCGEGVQPQALQDALSALIALGYKPQQARQVLARFKDQNLSSEELIKLALQRITE